MEENIQSRKKDSFITRIVHFLKYFFVEPVQDIVQKKPFEKEQHSIWRFAFVFIAIISFVLILVMSRNAGNSGDEHFHLEQAEHVYNYYTTLGKDSTAAVITEKYNLPYYGQSVDNLAYFITKSFGIDNTYETRHLVNSIFGWLAMFFAALIAFRIGGWRAGVLTFILIFLSPRFLGHSFNNLKDLPMATGSIFGIYCLIRFLQEFPKIKMKTAILFAIAIGFAISVRVAGLLVVAYFGLFGAIYFVVRNWKKGFFAKQSKQEFRKMILWGIGISLVGYIISLLLWPFALEGPISNVKETLGSMSKFAISIKQVFEGKMQWSDILPWYYTPKFILMTIPVAVITGALLYLFLLWKKKENYFWSFLIFFTFFFPVFWIVYQKSNVYGGWRHAMFMYPSLVVFAALGFNALIEICKNKYLKIAATVLPFLMILPPTLHIIRNHPHEYVYFNELAGGMENAYGNYEMDYYYHSTRKATEWIVGNAEKSGLETGDKIKVASWHPVSVGYYLRKDTTVFQNEFLRWYERGNNDWDYAVFVLTGISPERIRGEHFPPKNTIHTINVDKKPITIILKRDDKTDYYAYQQMQQGNIDSAIVLFNKALKIDPFNEVVLSNMANIYLQRNNLDSSLYFLNRFLDIDPNRESEKNLLAYVYYYKSDFDKVLAICNELSAYNPKFGNAYNLAAEIYLRKNDIYSAEKEYIKLMDVGQFDQNAFNQLMRIYMSQGLNERVSQKKIMKRMAEGFRKSGNKEAAKMYEEQAKNL